MEIICPNCSSTFNLPAAAIRPGAKLRCSVCKTVFPLPDRTLDDSVDNAQGRHSPHEPLRMAKPVRSKKIVLFCLLALFILGGGAGGGLW